MQMTCLSSNQLHEFVEGGLTPLTRAAFDHHVRGCARCRDGLRALHRVDAYLRHGHSVPVDDALALGIVERAFAGEVMGVASEESTVHGVAETRDVSEGKPWVRLALVSVAVAATVLVLLRLPAEATLADEPIVVAQVTTAERSVLPGELHRRLHLEWEAAADVAVQVEVMERAASARVAGFLRRAERLTLAVPEDLAQRALLAVAAFGGDRGAAAVRRLATRRVFDPKVMAEALIRTGSQRVAPEVWTLLGRGRVERDLRYVELHRLKGRTSSRLLVDAYLSGDPSAALRRVIVERPSALALLRAELGAVRSDVRVRALALLGEAGDQAAVPLLAKYVRSACHRGAAVHALSRVAHAGSREALMQLAEALPVMEDASDLMGRPDVTDVAEALRGMAPGAGLVLMEAHAVSRRASLRRRLLVAAGLTGDVAVEAGLVAALSRQGERRAALIGLAALGHRGVVPAISAVWSSTDRRTRRCAVAALAVLGGDEAARTLASSVQRSSERPAVMAHLAAVRDPWVTPVYLEGLRFRDSRERALRGLQRIWGEEGPRTGDLRAWRTWLGLDGGESPAAD